MLYVPHVGCVSSWLHHWIPLGDSPYHLCWRLVDFLTLKFNTRFVNLHKFETSFSLFDRFLFKFSRNIVKSFEDQIFLFKLTLYCNLFQILRPKDHTSLNFFLNSLFKTWRSKIKQNTFSMFFMHMDVLSMGPQGGEEAFKMNLAKNYTIEFLYALLQMSFFRFKVHSILDCIGS